MNARNQETVRELCVFALLVAIGVAGRWGQPDWEFTPIAATAIFAGCYFSRAAVAALVPISILAISDLRLSAYDSLGVLFVKYAAMMLPVLFGRMWSNRRGVWQSAWRGALCGFGPATLFFVATNLAVWVFSSEVAYPKTLAGLTQCYAAGVPFFRSMLTGDLFYLAVLCGCWAAAGEGALRPQHAAERVR